MGSCYALAALCSLLSVSPEDFQARLTQSPDDGSITLRFGERLLITVSALTDGEIALGTTVADGELWATAYEKAVGELRRRSLPADAADTTPFAMVARGGSAGTVLTALTGQAIRRFSCHSWQTGSTTPPEERARLLDELRRLLSTTLSEGRLATAGTSGRTRKVPSLSLNHSYSVIGYDADTDLVLIRDPHGHNFTPRGPVGLEHGYEVRDGYFRVPTPELVQLMSGFSFQLTTKREPTGYGTAATSPRASGNRE